MKKSLLSMFAVAAGLLLATSCSNDHENVQLGGESTITFTAEVPNSLSSRRAAKSPAAATSFGDGTTATNLSYAVYQVEDDSWTLLDNVSSTTTLTNLKATVSLQLPNGDYAIAFWADAEGSIYTFNKAKCSIKAKYDGVVSSNENLDAFYAVKEFTVNGTSQQTIQLKRPFAQLNIGTADLQASADANRAVTMVGVKVNTYDSLSLKSGDVFNETPVEFAMAALPTEKFPIDGYSYLAMNYLLMSADKKADNTVTVMYDNDAVEDRTFTYVPLQRNYRTNIYGNLLTSATDFNVEVNPDFDTYVWDGVTTIEPQKDADNNYLVSNAAEWAWLGGQGIDNSIILTSDIDFGGHSIKAIQITTGNSHPDFVVDGRNYTLSNVTIVETTSTDIASALFVGGLYASSIVIKDLTVKNINVDRPWVADNAYAAAILANCTCNNAATITNVHVDGANIKGVMGVGGIIGIKPTVGTVAISNCSVKNSNFSNYSQADESGYVASIIGRIASTVSITNCQAENNTIVAYYCTKRGEASIAEVAGVDTGKGGSLTATDVTIENVQISKTAI